jgi:1,4-alpha-glucan branching enzyme
MHEGSWGAEGDNRVWLNADTSWTYTHIYPAEIYIREVCTAGKWVNDPIGKRIIQQLCRELLLLESSDWQFLITTGAARDYAESRFFTHNDQFNELKGYYWSFDTYGSILPDYEARLVEIEQRDNIFPDLDPSLWVQGAHAEPEEK